MGPRSLDRGEKLAAIVVAHVDRLQWGRGLWTAESESLTDELAKHYRLQWGRGLWTAESPAASYISGYHLQLQWGRGLWTAESSMRVKSARCRSLLQWGRGLWTAERMGWGGNRRKRKTWLQWGRGLWTAERPRGCPPDSPSHRASMGPRSLDRGERRDPRAPPARRVSFNGAAVFGPRRAPLPKPRLLRNSQLQWGRGLWTAERPSSPPCCASSPPLQWGRGLWTAERALATRVSTRYGRGFNGAAVFGPRRDRGGGSRKRPRPRFNGAAVFGPRRGPPPRGVLGPGSRASMGPRSLDRGEGGSGRRMGPIFSASMGPRSLDRGEVPLNLIHDARPIASMGPRSLDRGEAATVGLEPTTRRCFNGAAVFGPRRVRVHNS